MDLKLEATKRLETDKGFKETQTQEQNLKLKNHFEGNDH